MSSKTSTVGWAAASASTKRRAEIEERLAVTDVVSPAEADQHRDVRRNLARLFAEQLRNNLVELRAGGVCLVRVEDLGHLLDLCRERGVRNHLAVRKRSPPHRTRAVFSRNRRELAREPRLADTRRSEERYELRAPLLDDCAPDSPERLELGRSPEHRRASCGPFARCRRRGDGAPHAHRLLLAFCDDRFRLLVTNHGTGRAVRFLADDDPVDGRRVLQARRSVDDIARDDSFTLGRARGEGHQRLAGVDRDPNLQVEVGIAFVQLVHRRAHRERGSHRAFRVVATCKRRAEDGHDRIADELLDGPAARLDLLTYACEVRRQDRAHVLGVEALGARREADEVGEEHCDDLALLREPVLGGQ